jgi:hypothetical protein
LLFKSFLAKEIGLFFDDILHGVNARRLADKKLCGNKGAVRE